MFLSLTYSLSPTIAPFSEGQKDVEKYRRTCAERERKSLELRGKEATVQRLEEKARTLETRLMESKSFDLERLAHLDMEEYLEDCKARRRQSLVVRAKEQRRHARWLQLEKERELEDRSRRTRDQAWDRRYMDLAKQRERAALAMDALRDAGCKISGNPFADVLDI